MVSLSTVLRAVVEEHPLHEGERLAWPGWYENFADQQCEDRTTWDWTNINMPNRHMMWWDAGYREWIGEDEDMTTTGTTNGIHKAICAVKLALASGGGIGKGRQAPAGAGGFAFRGIEDFDNVLCGLTAEHNIAGPYPRVLSKEIVHGSTAKGGYQCHVFLEVEWTYVCAIDGSMHIASTMGEAMDTQDKACNKAMQAARKYADVMVFRIPVGGDDTEVYAPEPGGVAAASAPQTQAQQNPPPDQQKRTRGPNKPKDEPAPAPQQPPPVQQTQAEPTPANYPLTSAKTIDVPAGDPFPPTQAAPPPAQTNGTTNGDASLLSRILSSNTFPILYAFAQEAESSYPPGPARDTFKDAIKKRAIHLFSVAPDMPGVQSGFELVTALGQPDDLKAAANTAYGRFRK